ncbi:MAG: futalosine hydrolase, partial [Stackebrandtia sp.]
TELAAAYPNALAEAMEGFGVATAAAEARLPFVELRTISNEVGDRDVAGWDWQAGFAALTKAVGEL